MDKTELIEFLKLFKDAQAAEEPTVNDPKSYDYKVGEEEDEDVKSCFSLSLIEDRLFTLFIFVITTGYLFLFVTGQTSILDNELEKFQKSQKKIHNIVIKFFNESYEGEEEEDFEYNKVYKEEKLKYDQYTKRDDFKLDLNILSKTEGKCSNDLMKKTAILIREQIEIIKGLEKKIYKENNKKFEEVSDFNNFQDFKLMFDPITIEKVSLSLIEEFHHGLNNVYVNQINNYFKSKFINIHLELFSDDSSIMKSKQELLFLQSLLKSSSQHSNSNFGKKIKVLTGIKEEAIKVYESNLKTILNDLKTTIEFIPIFPEKKTKTNFKKIDRENETSNENETVKINNAFNKFFNTFYSNQQ